jgi:hypothetical protein
MDRARSARSIRPVERQGVFVLDAGRAFVQVDGLPVVFDGPQRVVAGHENVAEAFVGAGRGRVQDGGGPQIPQGGTEVVGAAAAVGFTPAQVGQHRVRPQGDGPAEGLDRGGQVSAGQGAVALQEQALIVLFPLNAGRRQDGGDAGSEQEDGQDMSSHGPEEHSRRLRV